MEPSYQAACRPAIDMHSIHPAVAHDPPRPRLPHAPAPVIVSHPAAKPHLDELVRLLKATDEVRRVVRDSAVVSDDGEYFRGISTLRYLENQA